MPIISAIYFILFSSDGSTTRAWESSTFRTWSHSLDNVVTRRDGRPSPRRCPHPRIHSDDSHSHTNRFIHHFFQSGAASLSLPCSYNIYQYTRSLPISALPLTRPTNPQSSPRRSIQPLHNPRSRCALNPNNRPMCMCIRPKCPTFLR